MILLQWEAWTPNKIYLKIYFMKDLDLGWVCACVALHAILHICNQLLKSCSQYSNLSPILSLRNMTSCS